MIFVNLPVADVQKSRDFFTGLGFGFDEQFCDENAVCMKVNDQAFAMLIARDFFATFTPRPVADASATTEVLVCLSADSREDVDALVREALASGGEEPREPMDQGFMYGRAFTDLDGHVWEVMWMDPAVVAGEQCPA
ncbi:VOC family protein [Kineococcus xinjiangensis]|nr:VOC family protein [Kineococcus xinjiangensis]